jgi:hypothetical protein
MTPHTLHKHAHKNLKHLILLMQKCEAFKLHDHPPGATAALLIKTLEKCRDDLQAATTWKECQAVLKIMEDKGTQIWFRDSLKAQASDCYCAIVNSLRGVRHDFLMAETSC